MSLSIRTSRIVADYLRTPEENSIIDIKAWRANPLLVELSLWDEDAVATLGNVTSITLVVKETEDATVALMSDTKSAFSVDDGLGEGYCCVFDFASVETNLAKRLWDLPKETTAKLVAHLYATQTDDEKKDIAKGFIHMEWDGDPNVIEDPVPNPDDLLLSSVANSRFVRFDASQSLTNAQKWQALNNVGITYSEAQGALLLNLPTANGGTQVRITLDTVP